jgi:hypothetical protein
MSQYSAPEVNVTAAAITPTDRVRWGSIIAGLFAALSTLAILGVLGVAVGSTSYDPGDSARNFGIGAGVWGAISALIAFFIGGWLAARSAALTDRNNGLLNGAMVWVVAIPLMLYMLMGGLGSLMRGAGSAAQTGVQAAATAGGAAASDPVNRERMEDQAQTAGAKIQATTQQAQQKAQEMTRPENQEKVAHATAKGAWGTLVSLLLGLAAAAVGGLMGSRERHVAVRHHDDTTRVRNAS